MATIPCQCMAAGKGWMTASLLITIIDELDKDMRLQGRNIILLMDQAGPHTPVKNKVWNNVTIQYLPANTTCRLQPLDAGIIRATKAHYRRLLVQV